MKIAESVASILLSEDGCAILLSSGIDVANLSWLEVDVEESEDLGLWIRIERGPKRELLLVRWDYILAVSLQGRPRATVFGLQG